MKLFRVFFLSLLAVAAMTSCCNKSACGQPAEATPGNDAVVRLNVFYTLNPDADAALAKAAGDSLVAASRLDEGCISYDMFESLTTPGSFIIVETWKNDSLLGVHSRAPHFEKYVPQLQALGTMTTQSFVVEE